MVKRLAAGQGFKTLNLFIIVALLEKMIYKSMTERGAKGLASVPGLQQIPVTEREGERARE